MNASKQMTAIEIATIAFTDAKNTCGYILIFSPIVEQTQPDWLEEYKTWFKEYKTYLDCSADDKPLELVANGLCGSSFHTFIPR